MTCLLTEIWTWALLNAAAAIIDIHPRQYVSEEPVMMMMIMMMVSLKEGTYMKGADFQLEQTFNTLLVW